jgi:hypothetical protein
MPHDLRHFLTGHSVFTVAFLEWQGTKNGALLRRAADEGFEVMVTQDSGFADQHNPETLPIGVVILHAKSNSMVDLIPLVSDLLLALESFRPGAVVEIGK